MFEQESSGILNRLLEGERAWFKEGLQKDNLPSVIAKATGEHRKRKHDIDHFFKGERGDRRYGVVGTCGLFVLGL